MDAFDRYISIDRDVRLNQENKIGCIIGTFKNKNMLNIKFVN